MTKFFSKSTMGFYDEVDKEMYVKAKSWPDDLVSVTEPQWKKFTGSPPENKKLGFSVDGSPQWVDMPEEYFTSQNEGKKANLLGYSSQVIAPLQNAVDLDMATDEEIKQLKLWKKYSVLLSRVDASNPVWPEAPAS